jgi:8-oxo-dGTP diphosphatase
MRLLIEIKDKDFPSGKSKFSVREAARAVLLDDKGLVPILFVSKHNYHKIPGGGIDEGEDKMRALEREAREEVGCEIEITGEVGKIIEYRSKDNFKCRADLKQTSFCYIGKVVSKGSPAFTKKEIRGGFKLVWLPLEEAIARIESDRPNNYEGSFIQKRDLRFLKKARQMMRAEYQK